MSNKVGFVVQESATNLSRDFNFLAVSNVAGTFSHNHRETVNVQIVHKGPSYNVNTFRYSNMAMENTLFISVFPIETPTSGGFSNCHVWLPEEYECIFIYIYVYVDMGLFERVSLNPLINHHSTY